jgi:hypothetical protein
MKKCNKCKEEKPLDEFYKNKSTNDGRDYYCKICFKTCPKRIEKSKQYRINNKEIIKKKLKNWHEQNKDYMKEYRKVYNQKNKDRIIEYNKNYNKQNPHLCRWRGLLNDFLKSKNVKKHASTYTLLKYSPQELKEHLDKQGMNWKEHQIDHKVPITWFKPETPPYIVNDLRNLQPLEESINKTKKNHYMDSIPPDYLFLIKKWIKEEFSDRLVL